MPRQSNYSIEDRIKACEDYISGKRSIRELCNSLGIRHTKTVTRWVKQYRENGAEVFLYKVTNKSYSSEVKISAVTEYLSGGLSIEDVCNKYNICAQNTLKRWIVMYNSNMELNDDRRKREIYMAESGRKTTQAERKEIVEYCISNSCDAKETEKNYFLGLQDSLPENIRNRLIITVRQTGTSRMVDEALNAVKLHPQYAAPWIVFDRDQVVGFDEIISRARDKGVNVGWSNPCIEIWFHTYFGEMPVCDGSVKCVDNFEKVYKKHTKKKYLKNNPNIYAELCEYGDEANAVKLARARLIQHQRECKLKESEMYPGTGLHILVDEIKGKCG